jgi:hypothetical protein
MQKQGNYSRELIWLNISEGYKSFSPRANPEHAFIYK